MNNQFYILILTGILVKASILLELEVFYFYFHKRFLNMLRTRSGTPNVKEEKISVKCPIALSVPDYITGHTDKFPSLRYETWWVSLLWQCHLH